MTRRRTLLPLLLCVVALRLFGRYLSHTTSTLRTFLSLLITYGRNTYWLYSWKRQAFACVQWLHHLVVEHLQLAFLLALDRSSQNMKAHRIWCQIEVFHTETTMGEKEGGNSRGKRSLPDSRLWLDRIRKDANKESSYSSVMRCAFFPAISVWKEEDCQTTATSSA